jgi:hypothetical protein
MNNNSLINELKSITNKAIDKSIITDLEIIINKVKEKDVPPTAVNKTLLNSMKMKHHLMRCNRLNTIDSPIKEEQVIKEIISQPKIHVPIQMELPKNIDLINSKRMRKCQLRRVVAPNEINLDIKPTNQVREVKEIQIPKEIHHRLHNDFSFQNTNYYKKILNEVLTSLPDDEIKPQERNIYYISNIRSGGSYKYIHDLIEEYTMYKFNFIRLKNKATYRKVAPYIRNNDILFFQYLLYTDFEFEDIIQIVSDHSLRLFIVAHDLYFLNKTNIFNYIYNSKIHETGDDLSDIKIYLFLKAEAIIFPSNYLRDIFYNYLRIDTMHVVPHIDYIRQDISTIVPRISHNINLGIITEISYFKGINLLEILFTIEEYKNFNIKFHIYNKYSISSKSNVIVHGVYNENEIYSLLNKDNINGLIFLNNYAETYGYAFSKGINTGLPIFYTAIGALEERVSRMEDSGRFFKTNNKGIKGDFYKFIEFIINNAGTGKYESFELVKINTNTYNNIFIGDKDAIIKKLNIQYNENKELYKKIHEQIHPFAIYFPQFHPVPENDMMFYKNYTDMTNLMKYKKNNHNLETPHIALFYDYNLDNQ